MPPEASELSRLIDRVANGDQAAFRALYHASSAKLYGIALRILRRRDLADEVLQEVYVRIWSHAASFDAQRASPISWMAAIARNRALDEVRKVRPLSIEDEPAAAEVADSAPMAFELIERDDDARRLADCLDTLQAERRDIVRLAYLDGLSREQLSQRFNAPVGTIKTWLHRSLKELKDCLST